MLQQGQDWQSAVHRELRHNFPDADLWNWETGETSCEQDAAVSLFAELEGASSIAVVFDPWRDELFTAVNGGGAELNGQALHPTAGSLKDVLVGTASSSDEECSWPQLRGIYFLGPPRSRGVRVVENASIGHAWVAAGRLGAFFSLKTSRAGALLVEEAGGKEQRGLSASKSSVWQEVSEVLQEAEVLKLLK